MPKSRFHALVAAGLAAALASALPALAQGEVELEAETCAMCHADKELSVTFSDGSSRSLHVDAAALQGSVHGGAVRCTDCHPGYGEVPHAERSFESAAAFRAGFREACKSCHFEKYTQALDGVHYQLLSKGDESAPFCTDCHGSHDVKPPDEPRLRISETCSGCHFDVAEVYNESVHGKALLAGNDTDVPVCTDCHRSHDIADPRTEAWLVRTPELCGKCHTDAGLMAKYGLSPNVLQSYLSDFHGMTATLTGARDSEKKDAPRVTALCIDCHGVHDIAKTDDPDSPVLKANLVKTCRKCHPDASENFPSAWLSHYEPSWKNAPLVYSVKVFYTVLIPFMIGALVLQILLQLWRVVVNR